MTKLKRHHLVDGTRFKRIDSELIYSVRRDMLFVQSKYPSADIKAVGTIEPGDSWKGFTVTTWIVTKQVGAFILFKDFELIHDGRSE